ERARYVRVREDRLDLRGEQEALLALAEVERLDAERIAHQRERLLVPLEEREGIHAAEAAQRRLESPGREGVDGHPRVAVTGERPPGALELRAQFAEVEDLAVEDDRQPLIGEGHRLVTARRQVDDRQPPVTEAEAHSPALMDEHAGVVRAAAAHLLAHRSEEHTSELQSL